MERSRSSAPTAGVKWARTSPPSNMPTIAYRQLFASATAARRRCRGRGSGALRVAHDLKAEPAKPLGIGEEVDRDDLPSVMVKTKTTRACRRPARPRPRPHLRAAAALLVPARRRSRRRPRRRRFLFRQVRHERPGRDPRLHPDGSPRSLTGASRLRQAMGSTQLRWAERIRTAALGFADRRPAGYVPCISLLRLRRLAARSVVRAADHAATRRADEPCPAGRAPPVSLGDSPKASAGLSVGASRIACWAPSCSQCDGPRAYGWACGPGRADPMNPEIPQICVFSGDCVWCRRAQRWRDHFRRPRRSVLCPPLWDGPDGGTAARLPGGL